MALLSQAEAKEVEAAIAAAEARSAGELVVAVLPRSDNYDLTRGMAAAGWTLATTLLVQHSAAYMPTLWLLLAQVPVALVWWYVFGAQRFLRLFLFREEAARAVRRRAMQLFAERGVYRTRDRSGLLIVLSELEHRVEILGDEGIHRAIGTTGWEEHARTLVQGVRAGRTKDSLIQVIERFGEVLEETFPRRPDDTNELPDTIVRN